VALHYNIPNQLLDCNSDQGGSNDLPPGQYVVPFEIHITNLLSQQSRAIYPDLWAADSSGNATLDVTNGAMNGNDTYATWANGGCTVNYYDNISAGGSDALYGFIGPATPAQLAATYMYERYQNDPSAPPQLDLPLAQLLPHQGASWLTVNTGTPLPPVAASPSASPVACPSAPAGYSSIEQEAFNTGCTTWLGQVGQQLQFDGPGVAPQKAETDWCNQSDVTTLQAANDGTDSPAQLLPACLAGAKAAGAP